MGAITPFVAQVLGRDTSTENSSQTTFHANALQVHANTLPSKQALVHVQTLPTTNFWAPCFPLATLATNTASQAQTFGISDLHGFEEPQMASELSTFRSCRVSLTNHGFPEYHGVAKSKNDSNRGNTTSFASTIIWISDLAFKPSAAPLRVQLESLGGQLKCYKTHQNAARALDKKRTITPTIIVTSSIDAVPLLTYLDTRKELKVVRIIVDTSTSEKPLPAHAARKCEVVPDFEHVLESLRHVAADTGLK